MKIIAATEMGYSGPDKFMLEATPREIANLLGKGSTTELKESGILLKIGTEINVEGHWAQLWKLRKHIDRGLFSMLSSHLADTQKELEGLASLKIFSNPPKDK